MKPDPTLVSSPALSATGRPVLSTLYAGAVVIAALYFGRDLVVPLVLAALLAFLLAPACAYLQRLGLHRVPAVTVVVLLAFAVIAGLGLIVGRQAAALAGNIPDYQAMVLDKWHALSRGSGLLARAIRTALAAPVEEAGLRPSGGGAGAPPYDVGASSGLTLAKTYAAPLLGPVATGGVVLVFTIFIMMAGDDLSDRLVRLVGRQDLHRTILAMNDAARRLSRFFLYQLGLNAAFGVLIGSCLWGVGLPNPVLWGILAGLMRFVPYVGVLVALAPPVLLAIAVDPGWTLAVVVLALFVGSEVVTGQLVEPLVYGHSTGLSPLAVIVATAFWALMWGPIGLLIATPLTLCLVVLGRHVEALAFIDVIFGDKPPLDPPETFYQRALEGKALKLVPAARRQVEASSLTDYYDTVALPGLALAQGDLLRDALAFERLEAIHAQIDDMLTRLAATTPTGAERARDGSRSDMPEPELGVVCIPGRGQLDDLAALMAVQSLAAAGFSARLEPNAVLGASSGIDLGDARLCCLSVLQEGSSVSGIRYFIRRIRKRMPEAIIVIGLWHVDRDSPTLSALRSEGTDEHLVLSVGELLAFTRTIAARPSTMKETAD